MENSPPRSYAVGTRVETLESVGQTRLGCGRANRGRGLLGPLCPDLIFCETPRESSRRRSIIDILVSLPHPCPRQPELPRGPLQDALSDGPRLARRLAGQAGSYTICRRELRLPIGILALRRSVNSLSSRLSEIACGIGHFGSEGCFFLAVGMITGGRGSCRARLKCGSAGASPSHIVIC